MSFLQFKTFLIENDKRYNFIEFNFCGLKRDNRENNRIYSILSTYMPVHLQRHSLLVNQL